MWYAVGGIVVGVVSVVVLAILGIKSYRNMDM